MDGIVAAAAVLALVLVLLVLAYWLSRRSGPTRPDAGPGGNGNSNGKGPLLRSYKYGSDCYPCASPVDAQWGSVLYIAGHAQPPAAARRFAFWNTSSEVMTVRSFTFGGYNRKFSGIVELIADNLMQTYGFSNVVQPGGVFSLPPDMDADLMYKGWYNGPVFLAYTLGAESATSKYGVVGWAPMRLQDERASYNYFYDSSLKDRILGAMSKDDPQRDAMRKALAVTKGFKMVRNAAIHWKSGAAIGQAAPVDTISSDSKSQCRYVTELNTFDPVNVRVALANLGVQWPEPTTYIQDTANRAECLRMLAIAGSSLIMKNAQDLDNVMQAPSSTAGIVVTAIATSLWFYVELSGIAVNIIADIINVPFPGVGTAISVGYTLAVMATKIIAGSGLLANIPGIGEQLNEIGMQFAEGNTITDIAGPFVAVLDAATAAAAGNALAAGKSGFESAAKAAMKAGIKEGVKQASGVALKQASSILKNKFPKLAVPLDVLTMVVTIGINEGLNFVDRKLTPEDVQNIAKVAASDSQWGSASQALQDLLKKDAKAAAAELALVLNDVTPQQWADLADSVVQSGGAAVLQLIGRQINVVQSQLFPEATGKGAGKEDWEPSVSQGAKGYALNRRLWVNRELKSGALSKDARCSGGWKVEYYGGE